MTWTYLEVGFSGSTLLWMNLSLLQNPKNTLKYAQKQWKLSWNPTPPNFSLATYLVNEYTDHTLAVRSWGARQMTVVIYPPSLCQGHNRKSWKEKPLTELILAVLTVFSIRCLVVISTLLYMYLMCPIRFIIASVYNVSKVSKNKNSF